MMQHCVSVGDRHDFFICVMPHLYELHDLSIWVT